jgi:hypothetical protein
MFPFFTPERLKIARKFERLYLQTVQYVFQLSFFQQKFILAYSICNDLTNTKIYWCFRKMKTKKLTMGWVWLGDLGGEERIQTE